MAEIKVTKQVNLSYFITIISILMFSLFVCGVFLFERLKSTQKKKMLCSHIQSAWLGPFKFVYILYCPMESIE